MEGCVWLEGLEVPLMRIVSINRETQILVLAVICIETKHNAKKHDVKYSCSIVTKCCTTVFFAEYLLFIAASETITGHTPNL